MKKTTKANNRPSAAITLLKGKQKKNTAGRSSNGKPKAKKARGHFVPITIRYRTWLRHGSGVTLLSERFEESRKWIPAKPNGRRA